MRWVMGVTVLATSLTLVLLQNDTQFSWARLFRPLSTGISPAVAAEKPGVTRQRTAGAVILGMAVPVLTRMTKSSVSRILGSRKDNGVGRYSFKCTSKNTAAASRSLPRRSEG